MGNGENKGIELALPDPKSHPTKALRGLSTKDISPDAVISCRGEQFQIHKNLASVGSRFMDEAFYGKSKEESEGGLSADQFEVEVVKQMVHFLYHGTYTPPTPSNNSPKSPSLDFEEILAQVEDYWSPSNKQIREDRAYPTRMREYGAEATAVHFHIKMHNIADYYQMDSLSEYASMCIKRSLEKWDIGQFVQTLRLCWDEAIDEDILELFTKTAAPHMGELKRNKKFNKLGCKDAVAAAVASHPKS